MNVLLVESITESASVARDLALIKVGAKADQRSQVLQLAQVFRARVVDVAIESIILEITGTEDKIDGLLEVLAPYGILEMVRTGRVAMARGIKANTPAIVTANGSKVAAVYEEDKAFRTRCSLRYDRFSVVITSERSSRGICSCFVFQPCTAERRLRA